MNREVHVRFCEGLGVKFPGPTRPELERARPGASGVGDSGDAGHMIGTAAPDPDRTRCVIIREGAVSTS
jgi:hypothetical protein